MTDISSNYDSNSAADNSQHFKSMATSPQQSSPMTSSSNSNHGSHSIAGNSSSAAASSNSGISTKSSGNDNMVLTTKPRLLELVREVDSTVQLDEDVEEILMQIVDDFVDEAIKNTTKLALHRKSNKVEVRDVQLHLERKCNIWIPGFGTDELRPYKRSALTEAHKQRLALIRKTIKKY